MKEEKNVSKRRKQDKTSPGEDTVQDQVTANLASLSSTEGQLVRAKGNP